MLPLPHLLSYTLKISLARADEKIRHLETLQHHHEATIEAFAHAVDAKDQVTHGHIRRVQTDCLKLAARIGLSDPREIRALQAGALPPRSGKIATPEHILNKPGPLTEAEFEQMKAHAVKGAEILSAIQFDYPVIPIVRHHHENWDGTGYPDGLAGEAIPIGARILQVVDCFDALTSDRPYRRRMTTADALAIVRKRRGNMYDPELVDAFVSMRTESVENHAETRRARSHQATDTHAKGAARHHLDRMSLVCALARQLAGAPTVMDAGQPGVRGRDHHVRRHRCLLCVRSQHRSSPRGGNRGAPTNWHSPARWFVPGHGVTGWVAANRRPLTGADARLDDSETGERRASDGHDVWPLRSGADPSSSAC